METKRRGRHKIEKQRRTEPVNASVSPATIELLKYVCSKMRLSRPEMITHWVNETADKLARQERAKNYQACTRFSDLVVMGMDELNAHERIKNRLCDLMRGESPTELEAVRIALYLGVSEEFVMELYQKTKEKKHGNGAPKIVH